MAKRKTKQATTAPGPVDVDRMPPTTRFELPNGMPEGMPSVGKPVKIQVEGMLLGCSVKEYPGDRDSIRVKTSKVNVMTGGKKK